MRKASSSSFVDRYSRCYRGEGDVLNPKQYRQLGDFVFSSLDQSVRQIVEKSQTEGAEISVRVLYSFLMAVTVLPKEKWNARHNQLVQDPYCQVIAQPLMMIHLLCCGDEEFIKSLRLSPPEKTKALSMEISALTHRLMNIVLKQFDVVRSNTNQNLDKILTQDNMELLLSSLDAAGRYYHGTFLEEKSHCPDAISPSYLPNGVSRALTLLAECQSNPAKWQR